MKLTQIEKDRLAVCRDVLKWIKPSKVLAEGNGYIVNRKQGSCKFLEGDNSKKVAKTLQKECQVCAKGALFLSLVAMKNEFDFSAYIHMGGSSNYDQHISFDQNQLMNRLGDVFDKDQLNLVEIAFETNKYDYYDALKVPVENLTEKWKAVIFGWRYKSDIGRLKAIMNNMIANRGTFIP